MDFLIKVADKGTMVPIKGIETDSKFIQIKYN